TEGFWVNRYRIRGIKAALLLGFAGLVIDRAKQLIREVLLVLPALRLIVRVLVSLAMAELRGPGVAGVAQRLGRPQRAPLTDVGQGAVDRAVAGVRLRRPRHVGDRLRQVDAA